MFYDTTHGCSTKTAHVIYIFALMYSSDNRQIFLERIPMLYTCRYKFPGGGGVGFHMKEVVMLVGNFELNPKRRSIWSWPKLFLTPKIVNKTN